MTQRFAIVGAIGYRDAMDAIQNPAFVAGGPVATFATASMVNAFYEVKTYAIANGVIEQTKTEYAIDADALADLSSRGNLISVKSIVVSPQRQRLPRAAKVSGEQP